MTEPPIPASHLPFWLMPTAQKIRLILREKKLQWDYVIDMEKLLYAFPNLSRQDALDIIAWYEDGAGVPEISTKFEIIN